MPQAGHPQESPRELPGLENSRSESLQCQNRSRNLPRKITDEVLAGESLDEGELCRQKVSSLFQVGECGSLCPSESFQLPELTQC